jgi:hypothetical protein
MRAVNLAKVATQAEFLRIQHMLKRQGMRAACGLIALIFLLGAIVLAHLLGWQILRQYVAPLYASLIMLGADLLIAAIFGLLAAKSSPTREEREALDLRRQALMQARSSLALGALIPVATTLLRSKDGTIHKGPFWRRIR